MSSETSIRKCLLGIYNKLLTRVFIHLSVYGNMNYGYLKGKFQNKKNFWRIENATIWNETSERKGKCFLRNVKIPTKMENRNFDETKVATEENGTFHPDPFDKLWCCERQIFQVKAITNFYDTNFEWKQT